MLFRSGWPAACAAITLALMCSNCAFRSGCFEPSSALRLPWREKPSLTSSDRTVSWLIGCPSALSSAASLCRLLDTQVSGRVQVKLGFAKTDRPASLARHELEARRPEWGRSHATPGPPAFAADAFLWKRSGVEVVLPTIDGRAGKPRHFGNDGEPAVAGSANLGGREQPPPAFIERVAKVVPALLDGLSVDHPSAIVVFEASVNPAAASHSVARTLSAIQLLFEGP